MNFQGALTLLKEGKKLRRQAWQFFGFVSKYIAGSTIVYQPNDSRARDFGGGLAIYDAGKKGAAWRPAQEDLFADDWEVFEDEPEFVDLSGMQGKLRYHKGFFEWVDSTGACTVIVRGLADSLRYARK